ncbi:Crp/Fnr family transcriptional regulator [Novosphingobium sp. PC22D]|uniref:Crp/Fnr family transcriptional regulator n=1 Tax=Novosphingobium sp. PC22D TaxID=1962403 RepID=UPI001F0AF308|nr:Crp/Fnr family transcriptional regulator [Novosphingobium sp. PC22D]
MSERESALLDSLVERVERVPDGTCILERGVVARQSTMLIDGFISRVINDSGNRNIVGLQVPGDFVDLHAFALKRLDHDIVTVGPSLVAYVPHAKLAEIVAQEPHLTRLLWFSTLLDAAIHREWIVKLEQLRAGERLAHIVAELWHRLNFVGLADPHGFNMPLLQTHLANACGTTAVHINRVIKSLRQKELLELNRGRVTIPDRAALEAYAHFRPDYLYGEGSLFLDFETDSTNP